MHLSNMQTAALLLTNVNILNVLQCLSLTCHFATVLFIQAGQHHSC